MKLNKDIFCCIFNHNHNENSKLWLDRLMSNGFNSYILDSGSDEPLEDERVLKFGDIFWGGMYDEAVKLAKENKAKWLFVVCDDILIDEENFTKLIDVFSLINKTSDIGIWQATTTLDSHNVWKNNFNRKTDGIRDTGNIEGWLFLCRVDILDEMNTYGIDYGNLMKLGWGIDILLSWTSLRMGYRNVVDDSVIVVHPAGPAGYNSAKAQEQMEVGFNVINKNYNDLVVSCANMKNRNENHKVLTCCLFNYKHDKNANRWFNILNKYYNTFVIDTFHKEDNSLFDGDVPQRRIHYLDNVYWGGSYMEAYKIFCEENSEFLLTIDTDIEISDDNIDKMLRALEIFKYYKEIGVYTASLKTGSKALGTTQITVANCHLYNHGTGKLRNVHGIEGWFNIMRRDVMDDIFPHLSYPENKYGWGVPPACIRRAIKKGLRIVADDRFEVFHPADVSYNNGEAQEEENRFKRRYLELDCLLPEEEQDLLDRIRM